MLVIGASGFLGGYLLAELERRGVETVTAGRLAADVPLELTDPETELSRPLIAQNT